jgi:hypothetical protein
MKIEDRADTLIGIAERKGQEPVEYLKELIKNQITYLQSELKVLEMGEIYQKYPEIKEDIKRIFLMGDCYEGYKEFIEEKINSLEGNKVENE